MREDMAKVLVQRPRLIDSAARRGRIVPDKLMPKSIGLRRGVREAGGFKQLNENLKPLRRYLERQVGRPWNKVFSEIAANLKSSSTVQQHVRDHIKDFVELHPMADALIWPGIGWRRRRGLYVDPRDGLLKRTDRRVWAKARVNRPVAAPAPVDAVSLTEDRELRRLQGLWFEVRLAQLPTPEYCTVTRPARGAVSRTKAREITVRQLVTPAVRDIVSGLAVCGGPELDEPRGWAQYHRAHPSRTYAVSKRQLSRMELRRHGLANTAG
jgi:hypothetical protein